MSATVAVPSNRASTQASRGPGAWVRAHQGGLVLVLAAALLAPFVAFVNRGRLGPGSLGMDPDSALRLVQVRDLLGGQGWFDLTQHRLGLGGVEIHWSRLIDGPLAALIWAGTLVTDRATAEWLALMTWPTLWLGVTLWACLSISYRLGGAFSALVAHLNLFFLFIMLATFHPGRIDHHNVQLALLMLALWGFVARRDNRAGAAVSGLCVGTSLVVGVELLPIMAALGCVVAGTWVLGGPGERRSAVAFGAALACGMTGGFLVAAPASAWAGGYCDAVSMDLLVPVAGAGALLAVVAATLSDARRGVRLGVLLGAGGAMLALSFALFPACLQNPLDRLDPLLVEHWLSKVSEARGIGQMFEGRNGVYYVMLCVLAVGAVPACAVLLWLGVSRPATAMILVLCGVTTAMAAYQIRYIPFAVVLSGPAWAVLVAHLRRLSRERGGALLSVVAVGALLASTSYSLLVVKEIVWPRPPAEPEVAEADGPADPTGSVSACLGKGELERLDALPPGRVAATSNLGAYLLLVTRHEAISAPYHRNQAGMLAQIGIALSATPEEAERRMAEVGVDYLVLCGLDPELTLVRNDAEEDPILLRLARGEARLPGWPLVMQYGDMRVFAAP